MTGFHLILERSSCGRVDNGGCRHPRFTNRNLLRYRIFKRNEKSDITGEAKASAALLSDVGYIKSGIDDLKRKQEKTDERHLAIIIRLTAVEASAKQAHKRLDMLDTGRSNQDG